jgi:LysR family glycine cleavage system transcriptional activator
LAAFEAAARHEGFVKAGEELHLSASAVSHRVKSLERHLGHRLFHRLAHGVRLTDRGRAYLPLVRQAFDTLSDGTGELFRSPSSGTVVVRVSITYGTRFLTPRLPGYTKRNDSEVLVLSSIWEDSSPDLEVDLEVRLGSPPLGADALGTEEAVLILHPTPAHPTHRESIQVLGFSDLWRRLDPPTDVTPGRLSTDTWESAIGMVESSPHLCALVPSLMAVTPAQRGTIAVADQPPIPMGAKYWIHAADATVLQRPAVVDFVTWLRRQHEEAQRDADTFDAGTSAPAPYRAAGRTGLRR